MGPMTELSVPDAWKRLLARIERGTILLLGAPGTGKSSLARYLVGQLDRPLERVALVDADVGQSTVGVPTCLGLALTAPWQAPAALWFVGDVSPRGHLLPAVVGTARLAEQGRRAGAQAVVIDPTGFVEGGAARVLKLHKALAAGVDQVIALQRHGELEPILSLLEVPGRTIHRLHPVPQAESPSPEQRRHWREARFEAHFQGARVRMFGASKLIDRDLATGRSERVPAGTLVGLLGEDGACLALGVVHETGRDRVAVLTPWEELAAVHHLCLGALRLDPSRWPETELAD